MARKSKFHFFASLIGKFSTAPTPREEKGCPRYIAKKTPSLPFAPASPTHRASATVNPERKLYGGGRVRLPWGEEEEEKPSLSVHWQRPFLGGEGGLGQRGRRSAQKFDEKVAEAEQENRRQRKVSAKKRHANCIQKSSFLAKVLRPFLIIQNAILRFLEVCANKGRERPWEGKGLSFSAVVLMRCRNTPQRAIKRMHKRGRQRNGDSSGWKCSSLPLPLPLRFPIFQSVRRRRNGHTVFY